VTKRREISVEYLNECFDPDFENGRLIWKVRPLHHFKDLKSCKSWNARYSKTVAGNIYTRKSGYQSYQVSIQDRSYLVHRIIWAMSTGGWPENEIGHIDGNPLNNKLSNLEDIPHSKNMTFQKLKKNNKSGVNGVYWSNSRNAWILHVTRREGIIKPRLIQTKDFFEAVCARKSFELVNGFDKNHGV